MRESTSSGFHWQDLAEIPTGACIIGFPVAATEEIWDLGSELPLVRVLILAAVSLILLAAVADADKHNPRQENNN